MHSALSREPVGSRGIFRWEAVQQTMQLHEANREDHTDHLLSLMNFEIWRQMYLDGQSPGELTEDIRERMMP